MEELTNTDKNRIEVSVRQTEHLSAKAKGHPERQVAQYLARAFKRLDIPYKVVYDFEPLQDFPEPSEGKKVQLQTFSDRMNASDPIPGVMKDSNLLLTDRDGGGMAWPKLKGCIGPGGTLTEDFEMAEWVTPDDARHCVYGCLHEVAHNIGTHGNDHQVSFGRVWQNDDAKAWYRTPTGTPGALNLCGDENDSRNPNYEKRDCLYYADCARDHLLIR